MRAIVLAAALAACSSRTREAPRPTASRDAAPATAASVAPIEHRERCGDVTAIWSGQRRDGRDDYDRLAFELPGEPVALKFPHGEMYPPYWSFGVFAPDCGNVVLLHSYTGPYHVVAVRGLAAYLRGGPPDHVLAGRPGESGAVSDAVWLDASHVRYQWGCCDPPVTLDFELPPTTR